MANIFFVGGEDHDFTKNGICAVDTATTAARRTANTRCGLRVGPGASVPDAWTATLTSPQASFWLTARFFNNTGYGPGQEFMTLRDAAGVKRIAIVINSSANGLQLQKRDAVGAQTNLAGTTFVPFGSAVQKFDVFVNYAASGSVLVYADGTLVLSYTGNVVTDSATTLSAFSLGGVHTNAAVACYWSEVIASDNDTRFMSLITLAPAANGNTNNWDVGTVGNINEVTLDDTTVITSGTAGQLAEFTVGSSGVTGTTPIKAVCISARAGKGVSGPQNAKFAVRTGSADYLTSAIALQAGSVARIQGVFATNPATGSAWTNADLTAAGFNIGIQSEA